MRWLFVAFVVGCSSSQPVQSVQTIVLPPSSAPSPPQRRAGTHVGSDRDGDGIVDSMDKCPDDPEDYDGFQDQDGCPDPDNDGDGIPDKSDKCPNNPGPAPDGCPRLASSDRDGDGIVDSMDKCPDVPEDRDGFEDEDGCPDPDNDGDGILDKNDRCPNVPGPAPDGCPRRRP